MPVNPTLRQKLDHVTRYRTACRQLWDALQTMRALRAEWDALGLATAITAVDLQNTEHAGLQTVLGNGYTAADALHGQMGQGHATNLASLL